MKKFIAILMCILMVASLVACSSAKTDETTAPAEQVTAQAENGATEAPVVEGTGLEALKNKMVAELGLQDPIVLDNGRLLEQYGITEDTIASQSSIIVLTGVFPSEIIMVEAVDAAAAKDIAAKLQARLDNLKQQSQSYDADSYAIASACEVETEGNYVALFFSEHNEAMVKMFEAEF